MWFTFSSSEERAPRADQKGATTMRKSTMLILVSGICVMDQGLVVYRSRLGELLDRLGETDDNDDFEATVSFLRSSLSTTSDAVVATSDDTTSKGAEQHRNYGNASFAFHDLKLKQVVGTGYINYGFYASHKTTNEPLMVKIAGDRLRIYSVLERDILEQLNRPPTIDNIPTMLLSVHSMPNPYTKYIRNIRYFTQELRMPENWAQQLMGYEMIDAIVMPLLKNKAKVRTFRDYQRRLQSVLHALEFAHSRNIMNCDLHQTNIFWNGKIAFLFDWNSGQVFLPNAVPIHIEGESEAMIPPEGQGNETAVHQTVSAFDVYSVGLVAQHWMQPFINGTLPPVNEKEMTRVNDFIELCQTADPFQRPNVSTLLKHDLFHRRHHHHHHHND